MFKAKKYIVIIAILGAMIVSKNTQAHTSVVTKNTLEGYETRNQLEGTSSLNTFSIPHGCDGNPVRANSVVFPNSSNAIAVRIDTRESVILADHIEGNPVMSPQAVQNNGLFQKVKMLEGDVPLFLSHGTEKTEDRRAFAYTKGELDSTLLGLLPWRATFPAFKSDSCAIALNVNIAIANYCTESKDEDDDDRADIWIGRVTPLFNDPDVVSTGFWPFLTVIRDVVNNPIDESCGDGFTIEVSPSDESIDGFLPIAGYWPSSEPAEDDHDHDDGNDDKQPHRPGRSGR